MTGAQLNLLGHLGKRILSTYVKNFTHILWTSESSVSHKKWDQNLGEKEMKSLQD